MDAVGVWVRKNGEWAIIHRCRRCGHFSSNRVAADDNPMKLMSIAMRPLSQPPFPLEKIEEMTALMGGDGQLFDIDYWQFEDNTPRDWQLSAELENGAVKAEVAKLSGDIETAVVYVAAYDSDGTLVSVSSQEASPEAGNSVSVTFELDTEEAANIKAFLWTDRMEALDRAVKVK